MLIWRPRDIHFTCCCDKGDLRDINQDRILTLYGHIGSHQAGIFLVADGCGGMANGEKISELICDSFKTLWEENLPKLLSNRQADFNTVPEHFTYWINQINSSAYDFSTQTGEDNGSTMTLLFTLDREFYVFNVGDSRAYHVRKGGLRRLTEDHTLLADMVRNGEISDKEARNYSGEDGLTMCVGKYENIQIFRTHGKLRRGDRFILCSDGLYKGLVLEELSPKLLQSKLDAKALRDMIPAGNAKDNVSVLVIDVL